MTAEAAHSLLGRLQDKSAQEGFLRLGVAAAGPSRTWAQFEAWIGEGCHGSMEWLKRGSEVRRDPAAYLPGARSVVVVSAGHAREEEGRPLETDAAIARYAWSRDYHRSLRPGLVRLARWLDREVPGSRSRVFLDTAPVLEREWAARAGLGWIGKNGCLIDPKHGSWLLLGGLATTALVSATGPEVSDGCGDCRRCLEECPTAALVAERKLDARRCISYRTIEHKAPLDDEELEGLNGKIFGCDICQEVCPWNQGQRPPVHPALAPRLPVATWSSIDAIGLDREAFDQTFAGTPVRRAGFPAFARSCLAALVEARHPRAEELLRLLESRSAIEPDLTAAVNWARRRLRETR